MSDALEPTRFVKLMRGAPDHRKFKRMARHLGISRFEAFGLTAALWDWTDINRPYGDLGVGFTAEDVADSLNINDIDPADLLKAWVDSGLIDEDDDGFHVHGWMNDGRSGSATDARMKRGKYGAHKRHHTDKPNPECSFCQEHAPSHAPSHPERYQGASPGMPDVDEDEDVDVDLYAMKGKRETRARDYAVDDPERPFSSVPSDHEIAVL